MAASATVENEGPRTKGKEGLEREKMENKLRRMENEGNNI
jgi:hypothetical protein